MPSAIQPRHVLLLAMLGFPVAGILTTSVVILGSTAFSMFGADILVALWLSLLAMYVAWPINTTLRRCAAPLTWFALQAPAILATFRPGGDADLTIGIGILKSASPVLFGIGVALYLLGTRLDRDRT